MFDRMVRIFSNIAWAVALGFILTLHHRLPLWANLILLVVAVCSMAATVWEFIQSRR